MCADNRYLQDGGNDESFQNSCHFHPSGIMTFFTKVEHISIRQERADMRRLLELIKLAKLKKPEARALEKEIIKCMTVRLLPPPLGERTANGNRL